MVRLGRQPLGFDKSLLLLYEFQPNGHFVIGESIVLED